MVMASVSIALSSAPRTRRIAARPAPPTSNSEPAPARRRRHSTSAGPLKGVVAMVDVRVGADAQIDCSDVVARKLRELGASTVKRFTPKLTHMVLSHFTPAWKAKIVKWQGSGGSMAAAATRHDLKIASQLWVNACYVSKQKMAERPFFPVSQTPDTIAAPSAPAVGTGGAAKRRQSLGAGASRPMSALSSTDGGQNTLLLTATTNGGNAATTLTTPPTSTFKITKTAANGNRRKRRALSMEPMTSDAILKMLGSTITTPEVIDLGTPTQPIRSKSATSSAKRRRTISVPPSAEKAIDKSSESQATTVGSECVPESESEHEEDDKSKDSKVVEGEDKQPSLSALTGSSGTPSTSSGEFAVGTTDSSKKEPTARELRRANRTSLTYGSGLALKSGIWSCVACGCSNPRARKFCTDCRTPKEFAKQKTPHAAAAPAAATAASCCHCCDSDSTPNDQSENAQSVDKNENSKPANPGEDPKPGDQREILTLCDPSNRKLGR
ncbi:hypothetical protein BBJ28_00024001 [Nothophytophthora sp. Chile5]|nr:hypothetical protein BBJ28_00024001 [Nothophytophthora sp. Chile5]